MKSMTGFGRGTAEQHGISATVEISAVNSRKLLELRYSAPRELGLIEPELRSFIQKRLSRGTLSVAVSYKLLNGAEGTAGFLNTQTAENALKELKDFASAHGLQSPTLQDLLLVPGIFQENQVDPEKIKAAAFAALDNALKALDQMRSVEGAALKAELSLRKENMQRLLNQIVARESEAVQALQKRLQERIAALGVELTLDDERLAKEVAFYVDKTDITEETVRLQSHLKQYQALLDSGEETGRNFDFLVQEMSREINTLSSKTSDTPISADAMELKIELSKVKEQVANVE